MDQKELEEKIALYYSKLPPKAQEVFSSMNWMETLKGISAKYFLKEEEEKTLGTETTLFLLGIIHSVEYEEAITNELGMKAHKILMEIEDSIVGPIRPELRLAFETNKNSGTEENTVEPKKDERFSKLPKETQDAIRASNYQTALYDISKESNLSIEQMGQLEKIVTDLIVGDIYPDKFESRVKSDLQIAPEVGNKIVEEITEKIFKKIRGTLVQNTEQRKIPAARTENLEISNDADILNQAGIEIIPHQPISPEAPKLQPKILQPEKLEIVAAPAKEEPHPIITQKVANSFQAPVVETEHSLDNIVKKSIPIKPSFSAAPAPASTNVKVKIPNVDPYREIPD